MTANQFKAKEREEKTVKCQVLFLPRIWKIFLPREDVSLPLM